MNELNKYQRQNEILALLKFYPTVNQKFIANKLDASTSTISRDIIELENCGAIDKSANGFVVNPNYNIENIQFSAKEAFSLYQSAAVSVDRYDYSNPDLASSLFKLSASLIKSHPHFSKLLNNIAENQNDDNSPVRFTNNLGIIIDAWSHDIPVNVTYNSRSLKDKKKFTGVIIDFRPYPDGHDNHLILYSVKSKKMEVLRFKRIEKISLSGMTVNIPNKDILKEQFESAWKIWISENYPQKVELLFCSDIADRVLETIWHKHQSVKKNSDGTVNWECLISEPKEMEYWILGWGSNVKVINPTSLKESIVNEIKKLRKNYLIP